ncbi:hypothetical protein OF83DRAFT_1128871, partial [Amylostereum chailletii]
MSLHYDDPDARHHAFDRDLLHPNPIYLPCRPPPIFLPSFSHRRTYARTYRVIKAVQIQSDLCIHNPEVVQAPLYSSIPDPPEPLNSLRDSRSSSTNVHGKNCRANDQSPSTVAPCLATSSAHGFPTLLPPGRLVTMPHSTHSSRQLQRPQSSYNLGHACGQRGYRTYGIDSADDLCLLVIPRARLVTWARVEDSADPCRACQMSEL